MSINLNLRKRFLSFELQSWMTQQIFGNTASVFVDPEHNETNTVSREALRFYETATPCVLEDKDFPDKNTIDLMIEQGLSSLTGVMHLYVTDLLPNDQPIIKRWSLRIHLLRIEGTEDFQYSFKNSVYLDE